MTGRDRIRLVLVGLGALPLAGCVERTLKITSTPPGARAFINDEEVGLTPVKFSFTWYGDYDIVLRKPGYQTLKTHYRIDPPWYQVPPIDLVSETMVIGTIHDDHEAPPFELQPVEPVPTSQVVERAVELRERATFEGN